MKYIGYDGDAPGKRTGTEKFVELMVQRYGFVNLGTWGPPRTMRGSNLPSVHNTGRAADLGWKDPKAAAEVALWAIDNLPFLTEWHDYAGVTKKGCETWGRGWRVGRGWKDYTATDNAGTPGASSRWFHAEVCPVDDHGVKWADDPRAIVKLWKELTKLDVRVS